MSSHDSASKPDLSSAEDDLLFDRNRDLYNHYFVRRGDGPLEEQLRLSDQRLADGLQLENAAALQTSGRLGLRGLAPRAFVQDLLQSRLYGGDHGAHALRNTALLCAGSPSELEGKVALDQLLDSQARNPLVRTAQYRDIGGLWWRHEEPLPMRDASALVAADAAYFLLTMPGLSSYRSPDTSNGPYVGRPEGADLVNHLQGGLITVENKVARKVRAWEKVKAAYNCRLLHAFAATHGNDVLTPAETEELTRGEHKRRLVEKEIVRRVKAPSSLRPTKPPYFKGSIAWRRPVPDMDEYCDERNRRAEQYLAALGREKDTVSKPKT
ncbi:unnamed protein product [Peniophora sp. CBMAI 1063]|nr:unnamed protein product [Peniophora sp. CBMAI 1063]